MLATLIPHRTTGNLPEQDLFQALSALFVTTIDMKSIKTPHDGQHFLIPCHHFTLDIFLLSHFRCDLVHLRHLDRMATSWLQLSKSDFVNPDVLNAVNPHPRWGYAHGEYRI